MRWIPALLVLALAACDTASVPPDPVDPPDLCAADPDAAVVFPVAAGQRWTYALSTYACRTGELYEHRSSGTVEVEVAEAGPCDDGVQTFTIRERRTETTERRSTASPDWEPPGDPETTERTYNWTVSDSLVLTDTPDLRGRGAFAPPPFGREAPRAVPASDLSPDGSMRLGGYGGVGPFVTLRSGVGPAWYRVRTVFGTSGDAWEEWTIVE